ncbi:MAG: rhodanese-like domain-containing protein, partial [Anaerolineae bacterium]|uniref:rhodanese-like domain-containing protein n=1 Tax=Thermoflexus sp. TaxID=1969742 RepID=UPI0025F6B630
AIANYDEQTFVNDLLADQPEAPTYFAVMKRLNRDGMPILGKLPEPPLLSPEAFQKALSEGAVLVDTRDKFAFAGGHIPGAINIPAGKNFSTWAGWMLPYDQPLILLAAPEQVETLVRQLVRVGLDEVIGFIPSLEGYAPSELDTVPQVTAEEAYRLWQSGEAVIVDVRSS